MSWKDTIETKEPSGWRDSIQDQPSELESAARGVAQGGSLGFADELSGGAEALWNKAKGNPEEFGKLYQQYRDESRQNFDAAQKENPMSYGAGQLGGSVASAFVPGLGIAKGAGLAATAGKAALLGGVMGLGDSDASSAKDLAIDTGVGAGLGGLAGGLAHTAGPLLKKGVDAIGNSLGSGAEMTAARALGAERGSIKSLGADKVRQAGRYALDEGVVSPFAGTGEMAERNLLNKPAQQPSDMLAGRSLGSGDGVSMLEGAAPALAKTPQDTTEALLKNKFAKEEGNKTLGLSDWGVLGAGHAFASGGGSILPTVGLLGAKKYGEKFGAQQAALGMDKMSKALLKSPGMQELYQKSPQVFNKLAQSMIDKTSAKEEPKTAAIDSNSLIQRAGNSKYSQVLQQANQRGPEAIAATHFVLQQTDPEYRKSMMEIEPDEKKEDGGFDYGG